MDDENNEDLYFLLGIKRTNDQNVIRKAFIESIKKYHPDISGKEFEGKAKSIISAYKTLSDPNLKTIYDSTHVTQPQLEVYKDKRSFLETKLSPEDILSASGIRIPLFMYDFNGKIYENNKDYVYKIADIRIKNGSIMLFTYEFIGSKAKVISIIMPRDFNDKTLSIGEVESLIYDSILNNEIRLYILSTLY
jgi:DnaJ-class molecular chaperone